jgi:acetyltransferase-like isoleucine patch superfamily enzyme
VETIAGAALVPGRIRLAMLRTVGVDAGPGAQIASGVRILGTSRLVLGERAGVNTGTILDCEAPITLGRNVAIGPNCMLITAGHDIGGPDRRCGEVRARPIVIEEGAWLATGVTVLPGVTIGAGAVIAPGTIVRNNIPANQLWSGQGGRRYKTLPG